MQWISPVSFGKRTTLMRKFLLEADPTGPPPGRGAGRARLPRWRGCGQDDLPERLAASGKTLAQRHLVVDAPAARTQQLGQNLRRIDPNPGVGGVADVDDQGRSRRRVAQQGGEDSIHVGEIVENHPRNAPVIRPIVEYADHLFDALRDRRRLPFDGDVVDPGGDRPAAQRGQIAARRQYAQEPQLDLRVAVIVGPVQIRGRGDDRIDLQIGDADETFGVAGNEQRGVGNGRQTYDVARHDPQPGCHFIHKIGPGITLGAPAKPKVSPAHQMGTGYERSDRGHGRHGCEDRGLVRRGVDQAPQLEAGLQGIAREEDAVTEGGLVGGDETLIGFMLGKQRPQVVRQAGESRRQSHTILSWHCQNHRLGADQKLKQRVEFAIEAPAVGPSHGQRRRSRSRKRIEHSRGGWSKGVQHVLDELG